MTFPELYIAYVALDNGGKRRPVLVLSEADEARLLEFLANQKGDS